jgi:hypothetical protein
MYGVTSEIYVSFLKFDKNIILSRIKFVPCIILLRFVPFLIGIFSFDFVTEISKNNSHIISLNRTQAVTTSSVCWKVRFRGFIYLFKMSIISKAATF